MATDLRKATLSLGIDSRGARSGSREFEDSSGRVTKSATGAVAAASRVIVEAVLPIEDRGSERTSLMSKPANFQ